MILDSITLPDGLMWVDEFDWTPISQELTTTITGTLLVQEGAALAGRPITLKGGEDGCWVSRSVIEQLYELTRTPDKVMTLDLGFGAGARSVIWQRGNTSPLEAAQLFPVSKPQSDYLYVILALRFLEVT